MNGGREPEIEVKRVFSDAVDQMVALVYVYQSFFVERKNWLSEKRALFFAIIVINWHKNYRYPQHPKSKKLFEEYFDDKNMTRLISDYVGRIAERGWIRKTEDQEVDIPAFFKTPLDDTYTLSVKSVCRECYEEKN